MDIQDLVQTLATPHRIEGVSDTALVTKIAADVAKTPGATAQLPHISPAQNLHGQVILRPIDALKQLVLQQVPLIPKRYRWSYRRFAWLAYIAAFTSPPPQQSIPKLRVSPAVKDLHREHRGAFSADMGVGFGIEIASHWQVVTQAGQYGASPTQPTFLFALDIYDVLKGKYRFLTRPQTENRQPDYLLVFRDKPGEYSYRLLECKGTSQYEYANKQLARGLSQLNAFTLDHKNLPGVVISTIISNDTPVEYKALDPPDEAPTFLATSFNRKAVLEESLAQELPETLNERLNLPAETFLNHAMGFGMARLAAYAGDFSTAAKWHPGYDSAGSESGRPERREAESHEFTGHSYSFPEPDGTGRLVVYQGVASQIYDALSSASPDFSRVEEAQRQFQDRSPQPSDGSTGPENSQITSISNDGSCLIVEYQQA